MLATFFGYTPPARFDTVSWVSARIEESATETGSFTELETIDLVPIDTDPRNPQARGFTVDGATGPWFHVVWIGSDASESEPTTPVQFVEEVDLPYATRDELAALLKVDATTNQTALDRVLLAAAGEIAHEIGAGAELGGWKLALASEVNLERAAEHWAQLKSPFGFVGLGGAELGAPAVAARDSWDRHAFKLAPLKESWGIA